MKRKNDKKEKTQIFLVDDDTLVRQMVAETIQHLNVDITTFSSADSCLEHLQTHVCDLLISDVKMKNINGMELLGKVKRLIPSLPVILVTAYADVPMAVKAFKLGAADFLEKPIRRSTLIEAIDSALKYNIRKHLCLDGLLTKAEYEIMYLILQSKTNKEIALLTNRSQRTIEDHRRHIMQKLGVDNLVDFVKQAASVRIFDPYQENQ
jgi:two-component system, LuxR family, response regulator FixJ